MIAAAVSEAMTWDDAERDGGIPRGGVCWDFGNDRVAPSWRGLTSSRSCGKGVGTLRAVMQKWTPDLALRRGLDTP